MKRLRQIIVARRLELAARGPGSGGALAWFAIDTMTVVVGDALVEFAPLRLRACEDFDDTLSAPAVPVGFKVFTEWGTLCYVADAVDDGRPVFVHVERAGAGWRRCEPPGPRPDSIGDAMWELFGVTR